MKSFITSICLVVFSCIAYADDPPPANTSDTFRLEIVNPEESTTVNVTCGTSNPCEVTVYNGNYEALCKGSLKIALTKVWMLSVGFLGLDLSEGNGSAAGECQQYNMAFFFADADFNSLEAHQAISVDIMTKRHPEMITKGTWRLRSGSVAMFSPFIVND
jgi:hypothetical protein